MPPTLKLTIVTSIYGKPNKWVSTLSSLATATSHNAAPAIPQRRLMWARGWRITPCAPLAPSAHDNNNNNNYYYSSLPYRKVLGFRGQKSFSYYSSEEKGGEVLGGRESATDMDNNKDGLWLGNNKRSPPPLTSHNNHRLKSPSQHQSAKLLTLPTILTFGRVAAVPLIVGTFYMNSWWGTTTTTSIFIAAAITDWLDGYIARKMKLGSAFGAFLDPVADKVCFLCFSISSAISVELVYSNTVPWATKKLMVAATLVLLCTRPPDIATFEQMPWLLTVPSIAIIGREITMSAVREWAATQNSKLSEAVAVNNLGKWKTASQMTALTILLATRDSSLSGAGFLVASGVTLLYISAGLAVWSLVVYMRKIWKVLIR
ncbi:hypothetical protein LguiB_003416 [Lonicera macranthoides]